MVLRLFCRWLLVGGGLLAGLVTSAAAQEFVPVTFTDFGAGDDACSGPIAGTEFASLSSAIAAAEALVVQCAPPEYPYCPERYSRDEQNHWKWRKLSGEWRFTMLWRTYDTPGCDERTAEVFFRVVRPSSCDPDPNLCDPPACAEFAGMEIGRFYAGSETQGSVCANPPGGEENECAATVVGAAFCNDGLCYGTLAFTGNECGAEPPVGEDDRIVAPPPNNNCITSGGMSVCYQKWDSNCGLVNGEPWCASAMPENGCVSTDSGGVVCTADAWSAPTEPDGETPAEPDGEFIAGTEGGGTAYRYYRRDTVEGSGTPVTAGGPGPGGTGSDEPGEDDFEGELGELPTFDEQYLDAEGALASAWNAIVSSETVQAWMALGDGLTASEDCPTPQFELWQETYVIESHCDLAEEVRAELDLVFGFAWALLALVIVGKA